MSDYSKLKELAKALEDVTSRYLDDEKNNELGDEWSLTNDRYVDASDPAVVLGLIAENERLQREEKNDAIAYKAAIERYGELRIERDQLLFENKRMAEFKAHMVSLREAHGFDSWVAALVKIDQLKAECEGLRATASLSSLLPELDDALEELEIHGRHDDQGYRKLKDWYRKAGLACTAIDTAMGKGDQS